MYAVYVQDVNYARLSAEITLNVVVTNIYACVPTSRKSFQPQKMGKCKQLIFNRFRYLFRPIVQNVYEN